MNKVENAVIKYQLDLEAYKNGQANDIIALLDKANSEIAKYVKKTQGVYTKARYKEIERKLREISAQLKTDVETGTDIDGLIEYELHKQEKILGIVKDYIRNVPGGQVNFIYPSREQIKTAALFKPIDTKYGMTFQSYLDGIESGLHDTWDAAVRTGYLTGQPTAQIVRNVLGGVSPEAKLKMPGSMNALRNSIYANTRTALQSFANETRNRVMEANEKYFGDGESGYKYEYLATLDSRTCLPKGEKVLTPTGYVDIADIKVGDTVIGGSRNERKVTAAMSKYADVLIEVELENGEKFRCTQDHLVLTERGWVEAGALNEKDIIKEKL